MTFMKSGGVFSILFMVFVAWVFIADGGEQRITRACKPIDWGGVIVESITDLTLPEYSRTVDGWMDSAEFSCQYTVWRLFYEAQWVDANEEKKERITIEENKPGEGKKYHD